MQTATNRFRVQALAGLAAALMLCQGAAAHAASFTVNPTQIHLTSSTRSALLTLKNESDQPIRFQLSVMAWTQDPAGQMQLAPTQDVVFYPQLLTLAKGEERKVRVGVVVSATSVEKTYRLFVEELPPLETNKPAGGVAMLTKMGIPIFLGPEKGTAKASLENLGVKQGSFGFTLRNGGTVHFVPESVTVKGLDQAGLTVFDASPAAWYILAGGTREFQVPVPASSCATIRVLSAEVRINGTVVKETLQVPSGACSK